MSEAPTPTGARAEHRIERLQPWIAALASALFHLLVVLIVLLSPPITVATDGDAAGGSRVEVDFIGESPPTPVPSPRPRPVVESLPADAAPASRVQTTQVEQADAPLPTEVDATSDASTRSPAPQPVQRSDPPTPPTAPPPPTERRSRIRGMPPGMRLEDLAPVNAGPARSANVASGRRYNASSSEANMEAGGYQVIYDHRSEPRMRAWRDAGMTEVFLPLPGTQQLMVCPLETALRRESGPCRLVEPDDPGLADIGDAREVINMERVFRRGVPVWRGPGPYR